MRNYMKTLACTFIFLLSLTLIGVHTEAQNRTTHVRPPAPVSKGGDLRDADPRSLIEQDEIVDVCESQDSPKPQGEIKRVSRLCGRALSLPKPAYPEEAKSKRVSGTVTIDVITNEDGRVIWAKVVSGPDLLHGVSIKAACRARYSPTLISRRPVKTENTIQYNFVLP